MKKNKTHYDLIGDIHGHVNALETLLQKMGYQLTSNVYQHPQNRQVIFVGDFIDRGPSIRETLQLVKNMCVAGTARAVMGNHEYNAICFHTAHTEKGGFFRDHSWTEIRQHMQTLEQFDQYRDEWQIFLEWFKTLPLFIDEEMFRVVHACWDDAHIQFLQNNYKGMSAAFLSRATDKMNQPPEYHAIEDLLKGKEETLPNEFSFKDKDGATRSECRIHWWASKDVRHTYNDYLLDCPEGLKEKILPHEKKEAHVYSGSKPVFFGHYWLKGNPLIENEKAICLDYSVAKGGKLVAYRLDEKVFVTV